MERLTKVAQLMGAEFIAETAGYALEGFELYVGISGHAQFASDVSQLFHATAINFRRERGLGHSQHGTQFFNVFADTMDGIPAMAMAHGFNGCIDAIASDTTQAVLYTFFALEAEAHT
jgi:hypothetical protein